MISRETPLNSRMADCDEWLFPEASPNEPTSCGQQEEQQMPAITAPSIPRRRNLFHLNSWPTAFSSLSLRRRGSSSKRRSWSNRETAANLATSDRWEWHVQTVKPIPYYYYLENTAMRFRGLSPETVSKRISSFLRVNSISATYHDDYVECITSRFLKFVIQLWEGNESDAVIVEVQRRSGCVLHMRKLRRGIYQSITSEDDAPSLLDQSSHEVPSTMRIATFTQESKREGCLWTLHTAERLLGSGCVDQNKLGLECLGALVDSSMEDQPIAACVANALLCGTGKRSVRLREVFSDYFHDTQLDDEEIFEEEDTLRTDCEGNEYARGRHFGILHLIALQVLENSLKKVSGLRQNCRDRLELDIRSWFWRNIIEALVYNIEVADCRPLEAALSSKCLNIIMALAPEVQHCRCVEERLIPGLAYAHSFGRAHYSKLETESENLMSTLY